MGLGGLEPPPSRFTSSGRSSHLLDPAVTLHFLDLAFALSSLRSSLEWFAMQEFPGTAVLDRECAVVVVLENALDEIFGMTDVKAAGGLAAKNVCVERHTFEMVGLGGLEPPTSPLSGARSSHLSYRPFLAPTSNSNFRPSRFTSSGRSSHLSYRPFLAPTANSNFRPSRFTSSGRSSHLSYRPVLAPTSISNFRPSRFTSSGRSSHLSYRPDA